eukprot:Opistho-1_new@2277
MKKHTLSLTIVLLFAISYAFGQNTAAALSKHLGETIKYPEKAKLADIQGNSLILFTVTNGKINQIKVDTELGYGTDVEAVNSLLAFKGYQQIKAGKYALITTFKLDGSTAENKNTDLVYSKEYTPINLTITAFTVPKQNNVRIIGNNVKLNSPLFIVDGKTLSEAELKSIDPNTIESINVLKNAATTVNYGPDAVNGVVLI